MLFRSRLRGDVGERGGRAAGRWPLLRGTFALIHNREDTKPRTGPSGAGFFAFYSRCRRQGFIIPGAFKASRDRRIFLRLARGRMCGIYPGSWFGRQYPSVGAKTFRASGLRCGASPQAQSVFKNFLEPCLPEGGASPDSLL